MENPRFYLEGIVHEKNDLVDFEGPLTLILQLLSKNKIEIKDIKISLILDQYLAYLDEMASMDLEIASEFVAMAAQLVYIKSLQLLHSDEEEISELEQLVSSLEALKAKESYEKLHQLTPTLLEMSKRGAGLLVKPPEPLQTQKEYTYSHSVDDIRDAISRVFDRGESVRVLSTRPFLALPPRTVYTVEEKTANILRLVHENENISLNGLFFSMSERSEIVATFLAVLELCKEGQLMFSSVDGDWLLCGVETEVGEE